jgi:hypothetical protein
MQYESYCHANVGPGGGYETSSRICGQDEQAFAGETVWGLDWLRRGILSANQILGMVFGAAWYGTEGTGIIDVNKGLHEWRTIHGRRCILASEYRYTQLIKNTTRITIFNIFMIKRY